MEDHLIENRLLTTMTAVWVCLFLVMTLAFTTSFAQDQNFKNGKSDNSRVGKERGVDSVLAKLKTYLNKNITEKAYLQLDKPYYAAGDTIFFKAYATMGERHVPSTISAVLHVELINVQNKIHQSLLLELKDGVGWGDFALPDSLANGEYRIRAYTNWMRNRDQKFFFEKNISIGNPIENKISESGATALKPLNNGINIQFLPEGGDLVNGIRSRIAFKTENINGRAIGAKGSIVDNTGHTLSTFQTAHLGIGSFYLQPESGKSYQANVTLEDGTQKTVRLRKALEEGITLTVDNDSIPKATITIAANESYFRQNRQKNFTLLIYSGGIATTVNCKLDSSVIKLDVAKRHLFTGVNTATLFSPDGEPVCERLFFVQNYDQLQLSVTSEKITYASREKVILKLHAKNRADSVVTGHFSVSVVDESKVPSDDNSESTILTNLLLTSDLKGNVEQPNYYFNTITPEKLKFLDLVMLTNGYRCFEWKKLMENTYPSAKFVPEKNLEINGTVLSLAGKPISHGVVSLISPVGGPVLTETADEKGNFTFRNLKFMDSTRFLLQAITAKGKNTTRLTYKQYDTPNVLPGYKAIADVSDQLNTYLKNRKDEINENNKYGSIKGILLEEIKIRGVKDRNNYRSSVLGGAGHADQVIHVDDLPPGGELATRLNGMVHGVQILDSAGNSKAIFQNYTMAIVVDGVMMQKDYNFNSLNANDVETVEVLKYASASIYGMNGGHGVLVFTTRQGKARDLKDIPSVGVLPIYARGYYKARIFYSPQYGNHQENLKRKDLRATVYWNPEIVTDSDGNASVEYYNASGQGNYRVVLEGFDGKGNLGQKVYRYKVE